MKRKLLIVSLVFAVSIQFFYAQCTENASNFGNNVDIPMYNVSGDVSITLNTNNTITLDLGDNFATAEGPDIRAYLVKSNGMSDASLRNTIIANLDHIEFGLVGALPGFGNPETPINGAKSFTVDIPDGENIEGYDKIFFYCLLFNQFWDLGTFTSFSASSCNILNIQENTLENSVTFYPNPTKGNLTLENSNLINLDVKIFDVLGKMVFITNNFGIRNQNINVSSLKTGVYLIQITANNQTIIRRLIKQ